MAIRPTKRGWLTLAVAIGTFFVAMVNLSMTATIISAMLWAILPISLLMAFFSLHGVSLVREPLQDGRRNRSLPMPVTVQNHQRRHRQAMVIGEHCGFAKQKMVFSLVEPLKPDETRYVQRPIMAVHRGEYALDRLVLRGGDPAGLFFRQKRFSFPQHVVIYPAVTSLNSVPLQLRNRVVASSTGQPIGVSGLGQEFFGVRPYRQTDGMRFIHWKASARQHKLMVREFEENTVNQVNIFLDNNVALIGGHAEETNFERLVETAASLVTYLGGVYCRLLFVTSIKGATLARAGTGPTLNTQIMQDLANLQPGDRQLLDMFDDTLEKVPPNSVVYILSMQAPATMPGALNMLLQINADIRFIMAPATHFRPASRRTRTSQPPGHGIITPMVLTPATDLAKVLGDE